MTSGPDLAHGPRARLDGRRAVALVAALGILTAVNLTHPSPVVSEAADVVDDHQVGDHRQDRHGPEAHGEPGVGLGLVVAAVEVLAEVVALHVLRVDLGVDVVAGRDLDELLDLAQKGVDDLVGAQNEALASTLEQVDELRRRGRRRTPPKDEGSLWGNPCP